MAQGIVFSVRPPKKSWKNIANLSGGEKTLSSLSLVFALHHYKPTPLYVMDEIDAALGASPPPCFHPSITDILSLMQQHNSMPLRSCLQLMASRPCIAVCQEVPQSLPQLTPSPFSQKIKTVTPPIRQLKMRIAAGRMSAWMAGKSAPGMCKYTIQFTIRCF